MYDFIWSQVRSMKKMLQRIKSVLEVTSRRCYNVASAFFGSYLKKMLQRIKSVLEVTWKRCYDVAMLQPLWNPDERTLLHPPKPPPTPHETHPPKTPPSKTYHLQKWQQSRPSRGAATTNNPMSKARSVCKLVNNGLYLGICGGLTKLSAITIHLPHSLQEFVDVL